MWKEKMWKENDKLLGTMTDAQLGARLGVQAQIVRNRRVLLGVASHRKKAEAWKAECAALLGTVPDTVLAKQFKKDPTTIHKLRKDLKVPHFRKIDWEKYDPLIGTMPDEDLAVLAGTAKQNIIYRRKRNAKNI